MVHSVTHHQNNGRALRKHESKRSFKRIIFAIDIAKLERSVRLLFLSLLKRARTQENGTNQSRPHDSAEGLQDPTQTACRRYV